MKPNERREKIKELVTQSERVLVSDLSLSFEVTEETIRRDLEKLEKEGMITRVHGGAILNKGNLREYPLFLKREATNVKEKQIIAQKMLPLIRDGYSLMVDSSSTAVYAVRACHKKKSVTVISNSAKLLEDFRESSSVQIISTGGIYSYNSLSFTGAFPEEFVRNYNVDLAIFSCTGVHKTAAITDSNESERNIKRSMAEHAKKICLLVDNTKFSKLGFIKLFDFEEIDYLITDKEPPNDWREFLERYHIDIM